MRQDRPSETAYRCAVARARHQVCDSGRILDDPIALKILDASKAEEIQSGVDQGNRLERAMRLALAARSRIAEDELHLAIERGIRQYVILGAGFDTFAYRNPYPPSQLRVFEADHPSTQAWKRDRLTDSKIPLPASLTFTSVDFETQALAERLAKTGFRLDQPAFFSWLGVTVYLTRDAVMATMKHIAGTMCKGSTVIFDYILHPSELSSFERMLTAGLSWRYARLGEPWKSSFRPDELVRDLTALGYSRVEDIGADAINARLQLPHTDGQVYRRPGRMLLAQL
jgi:methyltransferase (TIGR00027 family)